MGIPQLTRHMQPHGTKIVLPQRTGSSDQAEPAIIDGPSLAYHCFYACQSRRSGARNALESIPSYRELGEAVVHWLQQIEQYGFKVKAIYFDGLLPNSKKPVRLSRLQGYANQLVSFKALNREDLPPRLRNVSSQKLDVMSPSSLSTILKSLPAPPFLVPAIIEALMSSTFGAVTSVIPGEADAYCAHCARNTGGTIFTSDSDLLVHDLGGAGKVVLFRDLESIHLPSKGRCLKAQEYQPAAIATKFDLPNLVTMAFYMTQDNHRSLTENIRLAKEQQPNSSDYHAFAEQYASLPVLSRLGPTVTNQKFDKILLGLDPRISELLHQVRMTHKGSPLAMSSGTSLDMYLPFVLDDPTRSSAWRAGTSVRTLAYSLLRLLDPEISSIEEFERKGTRISNTTLTLLHIEDIGDLARQLRLSCQSTMAGRVKLSRVSKWRAIGAGLVCQTNIDNDKQPPSSIDLAQLIAGTMVGPLRWLFIHACVQMQASLYSLRILGQLLHVVLASLDPKEQLGDTYEQLQGLSEVLSDLPNLPDLLDETVHSDKTEAEAATSAAADILQAMGVVEQEKPAASERKKKRKKKSEHMNTRSPPESAWRSNNMFGSLS